MNRKKISFVLVFFLAFFQPQDVEQEASGEEQGFGAKVKNFFKMFIDEN